MRMSSCSEEPHGVCQQFLIGCPVRTMPCRQLRRETLSCQSGNHLSPVIEAESYHSLVHPHHELLVCPPHPLPIYTKQLSTPTHRSSVQFRKLSFRRNTLSNMSSPCEKRVTLLGKPIQPGTKIKQTVRYRYDYAVGLSDKPNRFF